MTTKIVLPPHRHGDPEDRGSADAWYGRPKDPHYYIGNSYSSPRVEKAQMTQDEIDQYNYGYDNEHGRKSYE